MYILEFFYKEDSSLFHNLFIHGMGSWTFILVFE